MYILLQEDRLSSLHRYGFEFHVAMMALLMIQMFTTAAQLLDLTDSEKPLIPDFTMRLGA